MTRSAVHDLSFAAFADADGLSPEHQNRLAEILDGYLVALEQGTPITPAELLERHPDDATYLRGYLSGLELFHAAARPTSGSDVSLPLAAAPAGMSIGEFELVREIGRGGMGVVYEAVQTSLRRRVALKVLPAAAARDAKHIGRFKNEAQAAAQVQHPNIVPVFAVGEADGLHYFAMQLIEGSSLAEWIASPTESALGESQRTTAFNDTRTWIDFGPLPAMTRSASVDVKPARAALSLRNAGDGLRSIAQLGMQAAEALHAAHEFGVIHRDIKPSNLLVDAHGKLWVADFGLARIREGANLTQTGDICGTMRYMSPEQALGHLAVVDHRTDVYSLGVTLYELATGHHPAGEGGDLRQWLDRSGTSIRPLRVCDTRIPADFDTIVMKAISHMPGDRYATANELAQDLGRFLNGEPILASPPSRWRRLGRWAARHKRSVAAAAFALVAGMVAFAYSAGARGVAESAKREALQSSQVSADIVYDLPMATAEQLAAIPGTEGVRRQLLEESLRYYKRLTTQSFGDRRLGADLAVAYSRIATLTSEMGNDAKALEAHRDALHILEQLLAAEPRNQDYARILALCRNNAAMAMANLGRTADAIVELEAAQELLTPLTSRNASNTAAMSELATTYSNLGLVTQQMQRPDVAVRWFAAAIDLGEQARFAAPTNDVVLRDLAASYNHLGSAYDVSDAANAILTYDRAIELLQDLVRRQPHNQVVETELALSYNNLGNASASAGDWARAQRSYAAAMLLGRDLVKRSPLAASHWRELAATCNNQGMALTHIGRLDEAGQAFSEAMAIENRLLKSHPDDAPTLSSLGATANNLGMLLERQGRPVEAEQSFRRAIAYQKKALAKEPANAAFRQLLSKHDYNCARNLRERGKTAESLAVTLDRRTLHAEDAAGLLSVASELAALHTASLELSDEAMSARIVRAGCDTLAAAQAAGAAAEKLREPSLAAFFGTEPDAPSSQSKRG
jgi:serine/threonine protein kinase/Tfp pilus assembly protein PilF